LKGSKILKRSLVRFHLHLYHYSTFMSSPVCIPSHTGKVYRSHVIHVVLRRHTFW